MFSSSYCPLICISIYPDAHLTTEELLSWGNKSSPWQGPCNFLHWQLRYRRRLYCFVTVGYVLPRKNESALKIYTKLLPTTKTLTVLQSNKYVDYSWQPIQYLIFQMCSYKVGVSEDEIRNCSFKTYQCMMAVYFITFLIYPCVAKHFAFT